MSNIILKIQNDPSGIESAARCRLFLYIFKNLRNFSEIFLKII